MLTVLGTLYKKCLYLLSFLNSLQWRHNERGGLTIVYLTIYSRHRSKKPSKFHVTGLCKGNSPVTGEFPAQRASNAENVSIWWCHHVSTLGGCRQLKSFLIKEKSVHSMTYIVHVMATDETSSQGISSHSIDLILQHHFCLSTSRVMILYTTSSLYYYIFFLVLSICPHDIFIWKWRTMSD